MKTMLFNPYTGKPRHLLDIQSDPQGTLMVDPDEPVLVAAQVLDVDSIPIDHRCEYPPEEMREALAARMGIKRSRRNN